MDSSPSVHHISECFIKPENLPEESKKPLYLSPWDLTMLSLQYIQKGLLFTKPPSFSDTKMLHLISSLKSSLSLTLLHFYSLTGSLATLERDEPPVYAVYVDCVNSPGARFIHATLDLTVANILSPIYASPIVGKLFDHDGAVNHDGHELSLLSVKVTELIDGVFFGVSANHMLVDGTSFWYFLNSWSAIFNSGNEKTTVSRPPVNQRWIPPGQGPILSLPYTDVSQFIHRQELPPLKERTFHFSKESLAKLKARANYECDSTRVSTLQALSGHVWRCITRARRFAAEKETSCRMATNNRARLSPPVSNNYLGNYFQPVRAAATAGDLLRHDLGWAAWKLHQAVVGHTDEAIREWVDSWLETRFVHRSFSVPGGVMMGSSPRFDMYGPEFGLGKAVAIRSGCANKYDGKVSLYPGFEGGGSMDLEICLLPECMSVLESDREFMETFTL